MTIESIQANSNCKERRLNMNRLNNLHHELMYRARQIFTQRGCEEVGCSRIPNGEVLLFSQNGSLHLVYCLPYEMYVTTVEIQTCWEAQNTLGAESSSVIAPYRFSEAAVDKAWKLEIELLVFETD